MQNTILNVLLTSKEADLIREKLSTIQYCSVGSAEYMRSIRLSAYRYFPDRILEIFERQKLTSNPLSGVVFDNVPIDDHVRGAPISGQPGSHHKSGTLSENVICAFGLLAGEPYSVYFEGRELVNNLVPEEKSKGEYTGLGSEVELDFHIENAALRFMSEDDCSPMGMFLLGVRRDPTYDGPKTHVADARQALKLLNQEDIDTLYEKNFIIRLPYRWRVAFSGAYDNTDLCPMLSGPKHLPRLSAVFYPDMVLPVNSRARIAFDNLYKAIKKVSMGIHITPGKLVFIDNRFALHSRDKFSPTYDENNLPYRWIQRLFVTQNLWNFRRFMQVGSRVFDPSQPHEEKNNATKSI